MYDHSARGVIREEGERPRERGSRDQTQDPLNLVVVDDKEMQTAFNSVAAHGASVIGRIESNHSDTPASELGEIVWPMVKEAISGALDSAIR